MNTVYPPNQTHVYPQAPQYFYPHPITRAIASGHFLAMTILVTASVVLQTIITLFGGNAGFNIIGILLMIGMWIAYNDAKSIPMHMAVSPKGLNLISGTVKAGRILSLVGSILLMVLGVIVIALTSVITPLFETDYFRDMITDSIVYSGYYGFSLDSADYSFIVTIALILVGLFLILYGIALLVINYFFFLKMFHRFTYSVCENVKNNALIPSTVGLRIWLLVMGILTCVTCLISPISILYSAPYGAAMIVGSSWLKKYFS